MNGKTALYIHIPFCISKCAYCDFFSRAEGGVPERYVTALCNEISFRVKSNKINELKTVYIGGGTPSLLSKNQFYKIFNSIKNNTVLLSDAEITVEVNPDDVTRGLLETLSGCGVNRISCGIQSMNDVTLKMACRRADCVTNKNALGLLGEYWPGDVSIDLISGLPGDDEKTLLLSLEEVCKINPSHISLYSLTIEEETPFGKQLASGSLNYDFDEADKLWLCGRDFLESQGYIWYEVSNFCREGKECRHNLVYWTHSDYLGCGSGGTGTVYHKDGTGFRWTNTTNVEEYIDFWTNVVNVEYVENQNIQKVQNEEIIDAETSEFEFFMMGLRKIRGFNSSEFEHVFSRPVSQKFNTLFNSWQKKGLCEICASKNPSEGIQYCMSRKGMLFLNRFLEELC